MVHLGDALMLRFRYYCGRARQQAGSTDPAPQREWEREREVAMADLRIVTLTGAAAALGETVVERFGSGLRGELLRPDGTAYDEARKVWNGLIDKHPALIAR